MAGWGEVTNANDRKDLIAYLRHEDQAQHAVPRSMSASGRKATSTSRYRSRAAIGALQEQTRLKHSEADAQIQSKSTG